MLSNQVQGQRGWFSKKINISDRDAGNVSYVGKGETGDRNAASN